MISPIWRDLFFKGGSIVTKKRKWLFINTIMLTIYFMVSIPYYLIEMVKLENFAVLATLYFALVFVHGVIIFFAVATQWLGYLSRLKIWLIISTVAMLIGGILFFVSLIVIVPMVIINLFSIEKRIKKHEIFEDETNDKFVNDID